MKNLKFPLLFLAFAVAAVAVALTACKDDDNDASAKNEMTVDAVATGLHSAVYFEQSEADPSDEFAMGGILFTTKDLVITPAKDESSWDASMKGSGYMLELVMAAPAGTTDWTHTYSLAKDEVNWGFNARLYCVKNATNEMESDFDEATEWRAGFKSGTLNLTKIGDNEYEITLSGVCAKKSTDGTALGESNFTLKYKGKVLVQHVGFGS